MVGLRGLLLKGLIKSAHFWNKANCLEQNKKKKNETILERKEMEERQPCRGCDLRCESFRWRAIRLSAGRQAAADGRHLSPSAPPPPLPPFRDFGKLKVTPIVTRRPKRTFLVQLSRRNVILKHLDSSCKLKANG